MQLPPLRVQLVASNVPDPVDAKVSTMPVGEPALFTVIVHVVCVPTVTGLLQTTEVEVVSRAIVRASVPELAPKFDVPA